MRAARIAAAVVFFLAASTLGFAQNTHGNSIAVDQTDLHFGDTATFSYTTNSKVDQPGITVLCYKDGTLVYAYGGWPIGAFTFTLSSVAWTNAGGGAASCT